MVATGGTERRRQKVVDVCALAESQDWAFARQPPLRSETARQRPQEGELNIVVGPAKAGLGFHSPLITCESTADAPMLHHHSNSTDMWGPCTDAPRRPAFMRRRTRHTHQQLHHAPRSPLPPPAAPLAPSRPPPPDAPLAPVRPPSIGRASRAKPASISAARASRAEPASTAIGCASLRQAGLDLSSKRRHAGPMQPSTTPLASRPRPPCLLPPQARSPPPGLLPPQPRSPPCLLPPPSQSHHRQPPTAAAAVVVGGRHPATAAASCCRRRQPPSPTAAAPPLSAITISSYCRRQLLPPPPSADAIEPPPPPLPIAIASQADHRPAAHHRRRRQAPLPTPPPVDAVAGHHPTRSRRIWRSPPSSPHLRPPSLHL
ncbi:hypothetical protein [Oryza sativa Japonica Group]|uniref:Uncharacterized protein n=1 Tax=Oryza sativa subsp. japonica TaxID=39947 RepID=Q5N8G2_ORYSJ|nr:hypothetical protein [Oryza sativa Japonica Group]BAD82244.1 hypothetical protein [Oryza sativa Japonica Group]